MQLQAFTFEGHALPVITLDGRPAWPARDVGRVLGYADDGRPLVKNLTEKWGDELEEGVDYAVVRGNHLNEIKRMSYVVSKTDTSPDVGTDSEPTSEGGASFFLLDLMVEAQDDEPRNYGGHGAAFINDNYEALTKGVMEQGLDPLYLLREGAIALRKADLEREARIAQAEEEEKRAPR